jgi:hypothetical protein
LGFNNLRMGLGHSWTFDCWRMGVVGKHFKTAERRTQIDRCRHLGSSHKGWERVGQWRLQNSNNLSLQYPIKLSSNSGVCGHS